MTSPEVIFYFLSMSRRRRRRQAQAAKAAPGNRGIINPLGIHHLKGKDSQSLYNLSSFVVS
ncbi:MAG: hypothetical protein CVU12_00365 [Bacteroidetes bacterium HGW-Bacteroidetes-7]|jgi:hypothetical protein|nr:MAG: hypothetical protein CVU12_00365 [Bacteroidetes bacterium HGW-Bacteroidetes-7]